MEEKIKKARYEDFIELVKIAENNYPEGHFFEYDMPTNTLRVISQTAIRPDIVIFLESIIYIEENARPKDF